MMTSRFSCYRRTVARRLTCLVLLGACVVLVVLSVTMRAVQADETVAMRIKPYADNPSYWQYRGEPVLLLGGSDDDNLFQLPELKKQLDLLADVGGNTIRNTMRARLDKGHELQSFKQLPNGKYDLEQWNDAYWERFENMLRWTEERAIIVQIEVWDRFDYTDSKGINHWQATPYNPANNVNYTFEESGFAARYPDHPSRDKHPFFFSIPGTRNYQAKHDIIRRYQERFVAKMLSHSLPRGNVIYCMDNETSTPPKWGLYWMKFIRDAAKKEGVDVYVTDMFDHVFKPWDCPAFLDAIDSPSQYMFLDVSQNNSRNFNEDHWKVLMWIRDRAKDQPKRPLNNTKCYGSGYFSFGTGGPEDGVERFFRNITAGCASVRFHRPPAGNGLGPMAQASIKAARRWTDLVPMWKVEPRNDLLSDREEDEAYLAAAPGKMYAIYFTEGGEVGLDLRDQDGEFCVEWIDIMTGRTDSTSTIQGGRVITLSAPDEHGFVAAVTRSKNR